LWWLTALKERPKREGEDPNREKKKQQQQPKKKQKKKGQEIAKKNLKKLTRRSCSCR